MDLMKTETHPFNGVGDNSVFQTKLDLHEETLKKVLLALRRKHQKSLMPTTSNKDES